MSHTQAALPDLQLGMSLIYHNLAKHATARFSHSNTNSKHVGSVQLHIAEYENQIKLKETQHTQALQ